MDCIQNKKKYQIKKSFNLMIFDMDSTLIDAETINELANAAGVGDKVAKLTERAMRGELDYGTALRYRVKLLKGLRIEDAISATQKMPLMKGAVKLVNTAKKIGYKTAMISGGFTISANRIGKLLGMDYIVANELVFKNGVATGEVLGKLTEQNSKELVMLEIAKQVGVEPSECVVIGDGANDIYLCKRAGYSIAFNCKPILEKYADVVITCKDLEKVIPVICNLKAPP
ncbi:MAG: phosphoserine phosphatase SerB [Methanosarcinales archaeon]